MKARNQTQQQQRKRKPAQASSKAPGERRQEHQRQALANATTQTSVANYPAIYEGFEAMGIAPDDVRPRENVFTFNAWKELGRVVSRGQRGVKILTVIPCTKKDAATGEEAQVRKVRSTTVFHISQTELLQQPAAVAAEPVASEDPELIMARAMGFGCVSAMHDGGFTFRLHEHAHRFAHAVANDSAASPADFAHAFAPLN